MFIYFSFLTFISFLALCENSKYLKIFSSKFLFVICSIFLICFAGFRFGIETDYWNYKEIFLHTSFYGFESGIEIGWCLLISLCKSIFNTQNFNIFIFFVALLSVSIKTCFFSKLRYPFFALFLYFCFGYLMLEFNTMRQGLAISFLFLGASSVSENNKYLKFFIFVLIASLFHISSLIFLILLAFFKIRMTKTKISCLLIGSILMNFVIVEFLQFFIQVIPDSVSFRPFFARLLLYGSSQNKVLSFGIIRRLVILLFLMIILEKKQINNLFFKIFLIGNLLYFLFCGNQTLANRFSLSYEVFLIPFLADLKVKKNPKNLIILSLIILIQIGLFYTNLSNGNFIPYQTYL